MSKENTRTVLVVDDSRVSRMMIRAMLGEQRPDWQIVEAATGDVAVVLAGEEMPHYVTMDINMPGMNGLDAAEKILAAQPQTRIAMLTANIQESPRNRANDLGLAFFGKPVTPEVIGRMLAFFERN